MADEQAIYAALAADVTVAALIGARLWDTQAPGGEARPLATPYVIGFVVSTVPENMLSETVGVDQAHMQFDIYGATKASCKAVLAAFRTVLEGLGYEVAARDVPLESTTDNRRIILEFSFWFAR